MKKIMKTNLNFTFSTTSEGFTAVFELMLSTIIKPSLNHNRSFIPLGLLQLNVLLRHGLINDKSFCKNVSIFPEF